MIEEPSTTTIVGLFRNQEEAERGVNMLVQAGIPAPEIGFLTGGEVTDLDLKKAAMMGVGGGAAVGAVVGGLLGAASMLVAPGIGLIVTAGAWLPPLIGLATGASTGGVAGGLFALSAADDQALHYRQQVQSGRSLVNVTTSRGAEVQAVLREAGALEVADVGNAKATEVLKEEPKHE
jgi:uncharacterized membrane protein